MRLVDFRFLIDFLLGQGITELRLLGGEPLLHPQIKEILLEIKGVKEFSHIAIFTGGLFSGNIVPLLDDGRISMVVNVNQPKDYRTSQLERLKRNLGLMVDRGISITVGFNIYEEAFDYGPLFAMCEEFSIHSLRLCIANPSSEGSSTTLSRTSRKRLGSRLYSLIMDCGEKNIHVFFDCCLSPCMFTDEEFGAIVKQSPRITTGFGICTPSMDVSPDLEVFRCFSFGRSPSADLKSFKNTNELFSFFMNEVDAFKWSVWAEECSDCEYFRRRVCQGDCLGFNAEQLRLFRTKNRDAKILSAKAYDELKSGNFMHAKDLFEGSLALYDQDLDVVSDYVFALLKNGEADHARDIWRKHKHRLQFEDSASGFMLDGLIAESEQEYGVALKDFRKSLRYVDEEKKESIRQRIMHIEELAKVKLGRQL